MFMSPSCAYDAARHPPAHTGMNAQSPHSFHGSSRRTVRASSRATGRAVVDVPGRQRQLAGEARAGVERAVGADRVRVLSCARGRGRCARRRRREAVPLASPRGGTTSCRRGTTQLSQVEPPPAPGRRHARAAERLAARRRPASAASMPFGVGGLASRTTGLKLTFTSLSANSCALRNSSSAG